MRKSIRRYAAVLVVGLSTPAANKRLVYDFWREVLEAGHVSEVDKYVLESYVQHNPTFRTGVGP